jgi:hypothetical protein
MANEIISIVRAGDKVQVHVHVITCDMEVMDDIVRREDVDAFMGKDASGSYWVLQVADLYEASKIIALMG